MGEGTVEGEDTFAEQQKRKRTVTSPQHVERGRMRWVSWSLLRLTAQGAAAAIKEEKRQEGKGQIEI